MRATTCGIAPDSVGPCSSSNLTRRNRRSAKTSGRSRRHSGATESRTSPSIWRARGSRHEAAQQSGLQHVVPVVVLVERILQGDDIVEVLCQAVLCRVTRDEHKRVLIVAFRLEQKEIYQQMLSCELDGLAALGWQQYESVGLRTHPVLTSSSARARR